MVEKPKFQTLVELYRQSVTRFPARPIFGTKKSGEWTWVSYEEFGKAVDHVRGGLAGLGIRKGDRVAIISDNRPEWAIAAYASQGLVATFVPMYEAQRDNEWEFILRDCAAKVVFVATDAIRERVQRFRENVPTLEHVVCLDASVADDTSVDWPTLVTRGQRAPVDIDAPTPSDMACFIYTSGTTGNPKGVMLTHGNIATNVSAFHEIFPIGPTDRSLSFLPWAHSFGQTAELHMLLSAGASTAIAESVDRIVANLAEVKPTILISVPRIFNRIYDGLNRRLEDEGGIKKALFAAGMRNEQLRKALALQGKSSGVAYLKHKFFDKVVFSKIRERFGGCLRFAVSGGAAISTEVAEFIDNLGITVYEGYGLSETSPVVAVNWPGARRIGSVGKAIPGVKVVIDHEATGDSKSGEIIVYGPNVMQGYYNLPQDNESVFTSDGGLRTGDMGYLDDQGFLYITGRIKEQYKLENGKYVVPSILEERLKLSPYIINALIYGDNRPYNVALVVIDVENATRWATTAGLGALAPHDLVRRSEVQALVEEQVKKLLSDCKIYERVKKVALTTEDFTTGNDMLTPSLKVKRRVVMKKYGSVLEGLYNDG